MNPSELERYLHDHIPLSRAMAVQVVSIADDRVTLAAPLAPNINHRDTVFGGSASAVAILSAWSLLHLRLTAADRPSRVVIQRNTMEYLVPIDGDFTVTAAMPAGTAWPTLLRMLDRRGLGRITIGAQLDYRGLVAGRLQGEFVAFGKDRV